MRPKSKAELTAEIKTLQARIHNLETGAAAQGKTTTAPHLSEQEFGALMQHCPDAIARFDSALRHSYVSPAIQVMTGLPPQAFIGKTNRELGMPQDLAERWEAALRQVFETGQEVCIEFEYPSPDGPRHYESRLFPEQAQDGTIAAVFSIARDVTDRKRVEEALRESAARFRSLWEHSMDGILLTVPDGRILMASPAACRILGRSEEEICRIGRAGVLDPTDPRLSVLLEERARTGKGRGELRFIRPDGTTCPCEVTSTVFAGRDGLPWTSMCIRDITERKQAEEALRRSEENFRRSLDDSPLGVRIATTEGETVYANRAILGIYGYDSIEELRSTPVKKRYTPESYARFQIRKKGRQLGENVPSEYEISIVRKDGEVRHLQVFRKEVLWDGERQFQTIYHDITERKRAEEALRTASLYVRSLIEASLDPLVIIDVAGRITDVNVATEKATGVARAQLIGSDFAEYSTDPDMARAGYRQVFDQGNLIDYPLTIRHTSGRSMEVLCNASLYQNEQGSVAGVFVVARDITDRKQAEEKLRQAKDYAEKLIETANAIVVGLDTAGCIRVFNEAAEKCTGYARAELAGRDYFEVLVPRGRYPHVWEAFTKAMTGGLTTFENPILTKSGEERLISWQNSEVREEGKVVGTISFGMDITERKQAEEALLMRTRQLEAVRAIGEEISRELDLAPLLQLITERPAELMGAASGVVALWDEAAQILVPRAWFGLGERLKDLRWKPGEDISGITEGTTHTAMLAEPLLYGNRLVGVIRIDRAADQQPFTEMDRQLLALFATQAAIAIENARLYAGVVRRSEETASLLRASRSLMAGLDLQETLRRISEEACRIARSRHAVVLLRDREKQTLRLGAAVGGPPALVDNFARESKGSLSAIVASTGQPLFIADCGNDSRNPYADEDRALGIVTYLGLPITMHGEVVGVLTVNTSRPREYTPEDLECLTSFANLSAIAIENARLFEEARAGRERLRALSRRQLEVHESERRLLARELHDEVGQLLTGLKLTLDMVAGEASDAGQSLLRESQDLVGELIGHVRELSLNLRPALLDDLGLLPALLWQFERYTAHTRVRVDFEHAGLEGRPCRPEVETAAYRIAQEALTNVARHAEANEVQVRLWVEGGRLLLRIEDQGRGFEPTITLDPEESSGLAGMYERAMLLGGRLRIESSPGAGTRIQAELPLG